MCGVTICGRLQPQVRRLLDGYAWSRIFISQDILAYNIVSNTGWPRYASQLGSRSITAPTIPPCHEAFWCQLESQIGWMDATHVRVSLIARRG
jgi:hypothetical protein